MTNIFFDVIFTKYNEIDSQYLVALIEIISHPQSVVIFVRLLAR